MTKILIWVGIIFLVIIILAGINNLNNNTADNQESFRLGPGDHKFNLEYGGLTRTYRVHVPKIYDKTKETPLIINFHGGYGNSESAEMQSDMSKTSDVRGFIVVYPNAVIGKFDENVKMNYQHWNGGPRVDPEKALNVDDVGFISTMIDKLSEDFNIDEKRIYATGMSNGATMVYRLACQLSDKIAAFAPVAGNQLDIECNPENTVSIIHFAGLNDKYMPYEGGVGVVKDDWKPITTLISEWIGRNNCSEEFKITYEDKGVTCSSYNSCNKNSEISLCIIKDIGHTWTGPGVYLGARVCKDSLDGYLCKKLQDVFGPRRFDYSINDAMYDFFEKHPLD